MNLTQKIIGSHLVSGTMTPGSEIGLRIDQTLTQDATGTMAWLQFEALGIPRVKTDISLSYVDHNTLQMNFRNPDDHRFLRTVAAKFGGVYSGPGTGICHQLHLENFAKPGATLVGSDSHTPTAGGICSLAMGAGGLSVALAMAGEPYYIPMPKVVRVFLTPPRTSSSNCSAAAPSRAAWAACSSTPGPASPPSPCRNAPPLPTWARNSAPRAPSSPPTA